MKNNDSRDIKIKYLPGDKVIAKIGYGYSSGQILEVVLKDDYLDVGPYYTIISEDTKCVDVRERHIEFQ